MKNQYFGDINDYKKYGLLRSIIRATEFRVLVAWMMTPDDGGADGKFIKYLQRPQEYAHHDPALFDGLNDLLARNRDRYVGLIEDTDLIPGARYFSAITPNMGIPRSEWFGLPGDSGPRPEEQSSRWQHRRYRRLRVLRQTRPAVCGASEW